MTSTVDLSAVTWTPPAEVTWHNDLLINGETYPTRHPAPGGEPRSDAYIGDLTHAQRDAMRAAHEAAHAIAGLAFGGHVHSVMFRTTESLRTDEQMDGSTISGDVKVCNLPDGFALATFMGAGERAEDRWLREHGLWTPTRAAGVELGAYGDRRVVLDNNPHIGFGSGQDYSTVHDLADHFLSEHWTRVLAVACELAARLRLSGDEVADLAGLPNGTHSPTCAY
jgi:hypothetical protein